MTGDVAAALIKEASELTVLGAKPEIKPYTMLASKVAPGAESTQLTKGIRVLLKAKEGKEDELRAFLIVR